MPSREGHRSAEEENGHRYSWVWRSRDQESIRHLAGQHIARVLLRPVLAPREILASDMLGQANLASRSLLLSHPTARATCPPRPGYSRISTEARSSRCAYFPRSVATCRAREVARTRP